MSDLTARLNEITTRQDATNAKLDALIIASGGAPPVPGATLADVVAALALTNAKLDTQIAALALITPEVGGLAVRMTSLHAATTNSNNQLVLIRGMLDVFTSDYFSGDGTKQLLQNIDFGNYAVRRAILATFCGCDAAYVPIPPLLANPLTATLLEHCKRTQYQLDRFEQMLEDMVEQIAAGGGISAALISALFAAGVLTAGATVPPALIISGLAIMGGLGSAVADNVRDGYVASKESLRQAIYNAPNAAAAKIAFDAVITAASPQWGGNFSDIIKLLAWSSWFNDIYDTAIVMDTSGYDGTVCLPPPSIYLKQDGGVLTAYTIGVAHTIFSEPGDSINPHSLAVSVFNASATQSLCAVFSQWTPNNFVPASQQFSTSYGVMYCNGTTYYGGNQPNMLAASGYTRIGWNSNTAFSVTFIAVS